ncbi:MAG: response regulator [Thermodesulfobacteriota bacterium]|nr:response regulator [Thermodesulfobacteriota bacterium]
MQNLIKWITDIERKAGRIYRQGAHYFAGDRELSTFLKHLAEDEDWHCRVISAAVEALNPLGQKSRSAIALDQRTKVRVERPLSTCAEHLCRNDLTADQMVACIVDAEYSEWNDLFLYVIEMLQDGDKKFQRVASKLEDHKRLVGDFIRSSPDFQKHLATLEKIRPVWHNRILVVDDEEAILSLLTRIFEGENAVETAANGREALEKINEQFFDVIISDIDMPELDGIGFYREASKTDPDIGQRFLFFTGALSQERISFLLEKGISYILKPSPLRDIREKVEEILERRVLERPPLGRDSTGSGRDVPQAI